MKRRWHIFKLWLYAVTHAWTIARRCTDVCRELGHRESVNELSRHHVRVTIHGGIKGWSASIGNRYTFEASTLGGLLRIIAES